LNYKSALVVVIVELVLVLSTNSTYAQFFDVNSVRLSGPIDQISIGIPQIPYDVEKWNSNPRIRPSMFVDLLRTKSWLGKSRKTIQQVFPDEAGIVTTSVILPLFKVIRCGNQPQLNLEVVYDSHDVVVKYRATYRADGGYQAQQVTDWIK
jgi:hypothetical protein